MMDQLLKESWKLDRTKKIRHGPLIGIVCCFGLLCFIASHEAMRCTSTRELDSVRRDDEAIRLMIERHNCTSVYFDVGTNIGVQLRKLFEPHRYSFPLSSPMMYRFDALFGPPPRCRVCAIGLEPNPAHASRLDDVQAYLGAMGYGVVVIRAAAADVEGYIDFEVDRTRTEDMGAKRISPDEHTDSGNVLKIRSVDLNRVLQVTENVLSVVADASSPGSTRGPISMKIDIEGSEYSVLPHILRTGSLCRIVDELYVEWHPTLHAQGDQTSELVTQSIRGMVQALMQVPGCKTKLINMDDETYWQDGLSMSTPPAPLC